LVQVHPLQFLVMSNFSKIIKWPRKKKQKLSNTPKLQGNPFKKAICSKVFQISPKKPNSANRPVSKLTVLHFKTKLTAKIPGEAHNLQTHSTVLVRGGRIRDLIGVSYVVVRGKFDLLGVQNRKTKRSIYGLKKS